MHRLLEAYVVVFAGLPFLVGTVLTAFFFYLLAATVLRTFFGRVSWVLTIALFAAIAIAAMPSPDEPMTKERAGILVFMSLCTAIAVTVIVSDVRMTKRSAARRPPPAL